MLTLELARGLVESAVALRILFRPEVVLELSPAEVLLHSLCQDEITVSQMVFFVPEELIAQDWFVDASPVLRYLGWEECAGTLFRLFRVKVVLNRYEVVVGGHWELMEGIFVD